MPIQKEINKDFFKKWTYEMAYVLGFFAADGTMIRNKRGACFIEFHITDKNILLAIQSALGSNHRIGTRVRNAGWKTGYRLQIGSKELFGDLQALGFTQNKSKSLRMPLIPKKYFPDYVRGYFDGDGNIYFRRHQAKDRQKLRWVFSSRFTSGSFPYLEDLQAHLHNTGLQKGFISRKQRGYELIFSHHDSLALYRLMYNTISSNKLYLPRKHRLFRRAIKTLHPNAAVA